MKYVIGWMIKLYIRTQCQVIDIQQILIHTIIAIVFLK